MRAAIGAIGFAAIRLDRQVHARMRIPQCHRRQRAAQRQVGAADFVAHAGIPTFIDAAHAIAHNKIIIVDGEIVLTGSFNFTKAAEERNAENLLAIHDKALAAKYQENWEHHRGHSECLC